MYRYTPIYSYAPIYGYIPINSYIIYTAIYSYTAMQLYARVVTDGRTDRYRHTTHILIYSMDMYMPSRIRRIASARKICEFQDFLVRKCKKT